ncbi:MAG TPA: ABC transporter permease subunit [Verrucomicrobiae bacterium]
MELTPLLSRELSVATRRTITPRLKLAFGGGSMAVAVWGLLVTTGVAGLTLLIWLVGIASVFAMFTAIFVASDSICRERREGTLGFLFLTDLKPGDVIWGKLAAAGLVPAMALVAMFPGFALCQLIGGIPAGMFWKMIFALVLTLAFSLSATIFVSTLFEDHRKAYTVSTLLLIVLCPLWLPFAAVALGDGIFALAAMAFGGLTSLFLYAAARRIGECWRDSAQFQRAGGRQVIGRVKTEHGLLEKLPVAWMMLRRQRVNKKLRATCYVLGAAALLFAASLAGTASAVVPILWALLVVHVGYQFVLITRTAYSFYTDRQNGALELMLGTRMKNDEIFAGFNRFLILKTIHPLALLTAGDGVLSVIIYTTPASRFAFLPIGMALGVWITLAGLGWLGVYRSLMMKHPSLAMLATFARLCFVPTLFSLLFLNMPRTDHAKVVLFYLVSSGFLAAFFSSDAKAALVEHGRTLLLRPYSEKPPHIENAWSFIDWDEESVQRPLAHSLAVAESEA